MPGKMARSDPRPSVRVTEVLVAVSTSRLPCKKAGKTRTLMPVWDSSGESRLNSAPALPSLSARASTLSLTRGIVLVKSSMGRKHIDCTEKEGEG